MIDTLMIAPLSGDAWQIDRQMFFLTTAAKGRPSVYPIFICRNFGIPHLNKIKKYGDIHKVLSFNKSITLYESDKGFSVVIIKNKGDDDFHVSDGVRFVLGHYSSKYIVFVNNDTLITERFLEFLSNIDLVKSKWGCCCIPTRFIQKREYQKIDYYTEDFKLHLHILDLKGNFGKLLEGSSGFDTDSIGVLFVKRTVYDRLPVLPTYLNNRLCQYIYSEIKGFALKQMDGPITEYRVFIILDFISWTLRSKDA